MTGQPKKEDAIAYCHNIKHMGALSKKMVKQHECIQKSCKFFEKNLKSMYWYGRDCYRANPKLIPENEWYKVDVITCAAPNLKANPTNYFNPGDGNKQVVVKDNELLAIHEKRLRRILEVAVNNGAEAVVLGAFGCGAFKNKPEVVAQAAKNVIKDYLHAFKVIEYAVYCSPRDDWNYKVFERVLAPYYKK